ncbi:sucrase ferredoxin [Brevibacterium casei]|uniref:Sucrase ferredoxin n=1 Tax=Brevibacterium casei TaxID=33889 RepID=A0A269ZHC2_9MICO|nr:sucrase ferredoxin [Brevibacterium casei]MCT1548947.1 sucrase ferredoxin [Brevibacterium casei]MCT1561058.1 sucrase ferredoxin [Brevibacterium casei]MCT2207443.1 sucrase ferredoxin [Brevibacterium casei]PAK97207.1 sucrase ferredoxin [Brevibacterium casei]
MTQAFRCSNAARDRGDGIVGTAPMGTFWVLIEHRGGWPLNGFEGLDIDWRVRSEVFYAAQALRARILLIRRPGRRTRGGPGVWGVMHLAGPGRLHQMWGSWDDDSDLLEIVGALEAIRNRPAESTPGAIPEAPFAEAVDLPSVELDETYDAGLLPPVVLVCAHGQHDVCCAVRGRPVAAVLAEEWPDLVWECTHVGGDRFAANILVVPDGVYYGNLDERSALDVISGHLADEIDGSHLRGYTDLNSLEQVAVAAVLEHAGPAGRFDYAIGATTSAGGVWTVRVEGTRPELGSFDVVIGVSRSAPNFLTCRGVERAVANVFTVTEVRPCSTHRPTASAEDDPLR